MEYLVIQTMLTHDEHGADVNTKILKSSNSREYITDFYMDKVRESFEEIFNIEYLTMTWDGIDIDDEESELYELESLDDYQGLEAIKERGSLVYAWDTDEKRNYVALEIITKKQAE